MTLTLDNPSTVAPPLGRYSHSVEIPVGAGLVFISGQVPVAVPDGSVAPTLAEQADQVYANIVAVLAAKGVPPQNIIKLTTFFTEEDDPDDSVRKARVPDTLATIARPRRRSASRRLSIRAGRSCDAIALRP